MDGHREYYTKWNKSHRKKQIPNDFIYMWKLKNKTNEETQNRIIKKKKNSHGDEMYTMREHSQ